LNDIVVILLLPHPLEALVLRESDPQPSLWEALLPEELKRLPAELAQVDAYLDDERFLAPWRSLFDRRLGRPSVPVDTLLRLLYLKHRYQLGYETLCKEVSDSIGWRRFCRIGLDRPVPHPTKLVRRAGPEVIEQLNQALVDKLAQDKLLRGRKLRVDTTVIEADIDDPTHADLLGCGAQAGWAGAAHQGPGGGQPDPVPGSGPSRGATDAQAGPPTAPSWWDGDGRGGSADRRGRRAGQADPAGRGGGQRPPGTWSPAGRWAAWAAGR
jgi:Transposase domain (DUF772)